MTHIKEDGDLTDQDYADCLSEFVTNASRLPGYSVRMTFYNETTKQVSLSATEGSYFTAFANPETQRDWARFFDGWQACRKFSEKNR